MQDPIELSVLADFLNTANKASYADKAVEHSASLRPGSNDYHVVVGDLTYHDTYFGPRDFVGEEIVYLKDKPIWGVNYFGYILDDAMDKDDVYNFLREALLSDAGDALPVRGPREFIEGDWSYRFSWKGDLANFTAGEEILLKDKVVYKCSLHGGFIR
ncbi:MAG: XRE family transcriptional regulator [Candidatus Vogelbacteria bacterium CG10_big_fil_rev_8_21_14_0_10_51_16]|uniref:XRE family transcriptional regulator n=1 Tax=Candidatus Vogelbacteria bacterium CG10_big_fil_rev_8_21_14_0_10_51_16 TaxID=1975045 RepID=A0A2H0RE32_9BACT|nr:MAG: XRE family transcriptional regulator [Candidatus Vogelbacteria bacterium CG10_big_fil_rev_8_21_14_0_10_51_16]